MKARGEPIAAQWWEGVSERQLLPYELVIPAAT